METIKIPDRLNYSQKAHDVIEHIDSENYMGLGGNKLTRSELFLFAMSLGIESRHKTPLSNVYTGGLVLDKSIDSKTRAGMLAQYVDELNDPSDQLDAIADTGNVYKNAEQYANTGFEILADYLENKKPFDLALEMFMELDEAYRLVNVTNIRL